MKAFKIRLTMRRISNEYGIVRNGVYVEWPGALDTPSALGMQLQRLPLEIRPKWVGTRSTPPAYKTFVGISCILHQG